MQLPDVNGIARIKSDENAFKSMIKPLYSYGITKFVCLIQYYIIIAWYCEITDITQGVAKCNISV